MITTLAVLSLVFGLYEDEGIAFPVKRFLRGRSSDRQGIFKRGTDLEVSHLVAFVIHNNTL